MSSYIDTDGLPAKLWAAASIVIICAAVSYLFNAIRFSKALAKYPIINEKWDAAAKKRFTESAGAILAEGVAMVSRDL
jgi:type II secretory pathway component PulF